MKTIGVLIILSMAVVGCVTNFQSTKYHQGRPTAEEQAQALEDIHQMEAEATERRKQQEAKECISEHCHEERYEQQLCYKHFIKECKFEHCHEERYEQQLCYKHYELKYGDYSDKWTNGTIGSKELDNKSGHGGSNPPSKFTAYLASKEFVEKNLKAPSTAKFAPFRKADVTDLGGGRFRVSAYVDAQNSFGAQIRTNYTCVLRGKDELNWRLEGIDM